MKRLKKLIPKTLTALVLALSLTACGQTGPLTLPTPLPVAETETLPLTDSEMPITDTDTLPSTDAEPLPMGDIAVPLADPGSVPPADID